MCKHCDKVAPRCPWTHPKSFPDHCDTIRRTSYQNRVTWGGKNDDIWLQEAISCGGCQEDKEPERQDAGRRPVTTKPGMTAVHPTIRAQPVHWYALTTFLTAICACPSFQPDLKQEPKVPKASSISWFDRSPGPANSTEQLFFTLWSSIRRRQSKISMCGLTKCLSTSGRMCRKDRRGRSRPSGSPRAAQHPPVVKLLLDAYHSSGDNFTLDHIGMVMQVWLRRRQSAAGEAAAEAALLMVERPEGQEGRDRHGSRARLDHRRRGPGEAAVALRFGSCCTRHRSSSRQR